MKKIAITFLFFFISLVECREPIIVTKDFLKGAGEVSWIAEYSFYTTDHFWNKKGSKRKAYNQLRQHAVEFYAEYGLSACDTVGVYGDYVRNHEKLNWSTQGIGDLEFCWKRYLTEQGPYVFSSRVVAIIPSGRKKTTVRYGEWGAEVDLHGQRNFILWGKGGWCEVLAGYRYYHGFPSDQIKVRVVTGYQLFTRLRLIGGLFLDYGLYNGSQEFHGPILTLPARYRLLKGEVHVVLCMARYISLFVGGFQHLWGRDIGTGGGLLGGLWVDY